MSNFLLFLTMYQLHSYDYYPYGLEMQGVAQGMAIPSDGNPYQHGGKEKHDELGLDWYMYSLRTYDPTIGRWLQQDPYNQFFSPYCGMGNNPANFNDPTGGSIAGYSGSIRSSGPTSLGGPQNLGGPQETKKGGGPPGKDDWSSDDGDYTLTDNLNGDGKFLYDRLLSDNPNSTTSTGSNSTKSGDPGGGGTQPFNGSASPMSSTSSNQQQPPIRAIIVYDSRNVSLDQTYYNSRNTDLVDISQNGGTYQGVTNFIRITYSDKSLYTVYLFGHGNAWTHTYIGGQRQTPDQLASDAGFTAMIRMFSTKMVKANNNNRVSQGNLCVLACTGNDTQYPPEIGTKASHVIKSLLDGQNLYLPGGHNYYNFRIRNSITRGFYNSQILGAANGEGPLGPIQFMKNGSIKGTGFFIQPNLNGTIQLFNGN